ncbi:hypothetical protein [Geomonas sp.]|uniref:hypothetical protein n=1 Tax=Geomonas sp. TaxID=2651584 RepID=UPI002B4720FA|nr:hypothetical protein [Geomonas sp.]HJV36182.1 hypothetical protein [Geomonas sp.]
MRKSTVFIGFIGLNLLAGLLLLLHVSLGAGERDGTITSCRREVALLKLTDLALFTEARYTRNPSVADRHAAFQDHPFALEHFPAGSLVAPPAPLRRTP